MAKITPLHKKGPAEDVSNYRPISNLCSIRKFFKKLILTRIKALEDCNPGDPSSPFKRTGQRQWLHHL
jgi:hypothetical protein